uniref:Uncharacterized protein n=1 Tax=Anguilla anguilla TaxID=7936 RepID=A0A0E9U7B7_ANGAN
MYIFLLRDIYKLIQNITNKGKCLAHKKTIQLRKYINIIIVHSVKSSFTKIYVT